MTISRAQMRRELRANGGIMGLSKEGIGGGDYKGIDMGSRVGFGLIKKIKNFARKIIPNEIADIAVKAAPFVAPFNPALGGAMAGIGSFDQTGSISKGVKSGLINYGLGQGARYLGGAGFQGNPLQGDLFSSPMGSETGIGKMLSDRAASKGVSLKQGMSKKPYNEYLGIEEYLEANNPGALTTDQSLNLLKQKTNVVATSMDSTSPFMDSAKKLISGDFTEMGEGLKELGGNGIKAVFTKPHPTIKGETIFDKTAAFAAIAGGATFLDAKKLAEESGLVVDGDEYTEDMYETDKAFYLEKYQKALPSKNFYQKGGRVKYGNGSGDGIPSIMLEENEENDLDVEALNETLRKYPNSINEITDFEPGIFRPNEPTDQGPYPMDDKTQEEKEAEMLYELERELNSQKYGEAGVPLLTLDSSGEIIDDGLYKGKKDGGRIGFKDGPKFKGKPLDYTGSGKDSPQKRSGIISINPMQGDLESLGGGIGGALSVFSRAEKSFLFKTLAKGGGADRTFTMPQLFRTLKSPGKFPKDEAALKAFLKIKGFKEGGRIGFNMGTEVPVRENQGGISELDYRNTGGFVPIGVKEKADDVPAMLSKNEFVFTADAVRAAGGGSMNKGAQKMYGLMKSLENKVV